MPINVWIGLRIFWLSGNKMCGPTGIGGLYARAEILNSIPPWHGGGDDRQVDFRKSAFKKAPHRFEAGTPNIAGGLAAAIDWHRADRTLIIFGTRHPLTIADVSPNCRMRISGQRTTWRLVSMRRIRTISANLRNQHGWLCAAGHHCNQPPLMAYLTSRASFYFITRRSNRSMIEILDAAVGFFF